MDNKIDAAVSTALTKQRELWFEFNIKVYKDSTFDLVVPPDLNMIVALDFLLAAAKVTSQRLVHALQQQHRRIQPVAGVPPEIAALMRRGKPS